MGQKINPIIFRKNNFNQLSSIWNCKSFSNPNLLFFDFEIRKFLFFLFISRGIVLRSCRIFRNSNSLFLELDLYFSLNLSKHVKFGWSKKFFSCLAKKYASLNRMKDLKSFLEKYANAGLNSSYSLLLENKSVNNNLFLIDTNNRALFFLSFRDKRQIMIKRKKKLSILSVLKKAYFSKFVRIKFSKLFKLFSFNKYKLKFQSNLVNKEFNHFVFSENYYNLIVLNKSLSKTLQNYLGLENVSMRLYSSHLTYMPALKPYLGVFLKELFFFRRNRHVKKYFFEVIEVLYTSLATFTVGNAKLFSTLLIFLLENTRQHVLFIKLINKILNVFFEKLPSNLLSVGGVKILIKGRFNKRRRTKTLVLQEGQISLQTLNMPLDYHSTKAVTLYGSFGIKIWLSKKQKKRESNSAVRVLACHVKSRGFESRFSRFMSVLLFEFF